MEAKGLSTGFGSERVLIAVCKEDFPFPDNDTVDAGPWPWWLRCHEWIAIDFHIYPRLSADTPRTPAPESAIRMLSPCGERAVMPLNKIPSGILVTLVALVGEGRQSG